MKPAKFGEFNKLLESQTFKNREDIWSKGFHKYQVNGISWDTSGADAIVLNGGYEDNDYGDEILYVGEGGRKKDSKIHTFNQDLKKGNLALVKNIEQGIQTRVFRGPDLKSKYKKSIEPYEYSGLYNVESFKSTTGKDGYRIFVFKLVKYSNLVNTDETVNRRGETVVSRIIRDNKLTKEVKELYNYECQVCRVSLKTSTGSYVEAAHIKPLGSPHNGPDSLNNIICLCPNHHVLFDYFGFSINEDFTLSGLKGSLIVKDGHEINHEYLNYHSNHYNLLLER